VAAADNHDHDEEKRRDEKRSKFGVIVFALVAKFLLARRGQLQIEITTL
jgi:hypothetical protein